MKNFALALLPALALARGKNDGSSWDNCVDTYLIGSADTPEASSLVLCSYNSAGASSPEIHGDLIFTGKNVFPGVRFGYCVDLGDTWDCAVHDGMFDGAKIADENEITYRSTFKITDKNINDKKDKLVAADVDTLVDPSKNKDISYNNAKSTHSWSSIPSKCTKEGAVVAEGQSKVNVEGNSHFFRDFATDSETQDKKLTLDDAGIAKRWPVQGFWVQYGNDALTTAIPNTTVVGDVKEVQFVFQAFKDAQDGDGGDDGDSGDKDDGATGVTSFAAVVVTAISSLFF